MSLCAKQALLLFTERDGAVSRRTAVQRSGSSAMPHCPVHHNPDSAMLWAAHFSQGRSRRSAALRDTCWPDLIMAKRLQMSVSAACIVVGCVVLS